MGSVIDVFDDDEDDASEIMEDQYQQTREDLKPYTSSGVKANNTLMELLGLGEGTNSASKALYALQNSPGYQFGLKEGLNTLSGKNANLGQYFSGTQIKGANRYAQDYATKGLSSIYGALSDLSARGESAAAGVAQSGENMAGAKAQSELEKGNDWQSLGDDAAMAAWFYS